MDIHKSRKKTATAPNNELKITLEDLLGEIVRQHVETRNPPRPKRRRKVVPITQNVKASAAKGHPKGSPTPSSKRKGKPEPPNKQASKPQLALTGRAVQVVAMLKQAGGATVKQIMKTTGWQAHSVRGFISGVLRKKLGLKVESKKHDGERHYSVR